MPAPSAREGLEYENTDESGRELFFEEKVENRGKSHQAKNKGLAKIAPPPKALLLFHLRFISLFLLLLSFCSIREN